MVDKAPSSLEYASLLHELTLKKWMEYILQRSWGRAEVAAQKLSESREKFWSWLGSYNMAVTHLCQGKSERALESLATTTHVYAEASQLVASARIMAAHVLIEMGRPSQAAESAEQALGLCGESPLAGEALFFFGQARLRQGQLKEAEQIAARLMEGGLPHRTGEAKVLHHPLRGEIALEQGDPAGAIQELERADALFRETTRPDLSGTNLHVPVRFSLASAYLQSEQTDTAIRVLEDLVRDTRALLHRPIPFVRSFFHLGKAWAQKGETSKATEYLERFIRYWKEGQLDSDKIEEAKEMLSG
jgi:tetratricopeptide (TPR) repeat protein